MRVQIKTNGPIKDLHIKALYLVDEAMKSCECDKMRIATLEFFADKYGMELRPKPKGQNE